MKRLNGVLKFFFIAVLLVLVLSVAIKTVNTNLFALDPDPKADGARDPHAHVGERTLCYNIESWACDSN